ncbi:ketoacyl-synthetase C-terminal extension domain-containing protein [Nonomuraea recticatena]|uniref:ketoacyl-synthetase C-terminal extension domain-containing protein n=1 Tax=Nonomuraea recticatena TaxID=46178 RepID=UPI003619E128
MVQAMRHGVLPPTLHVTEPTPHVDWDSGGVRVATRAVDLPTDRPARAGISSFGVSGTNAHVVLEGAPATAPEERPAAAGEPLVWIVSAKTETALRAQAGRLRRYAAGVPDDDLRAAGRALATRAGFAHRAVVVAEDRAELLAALTAVAEGTPTPPPSWARRSPPPGPCSSSPARAPSGRAWPSTSWTPARSSAPGC